MQNIIRPILSAVLRRHADVKPAAVKTQPVELAGVDLLRVGGGLAPRGTWAPEILGSVVEAPRGTW